MSIIGSFHQKLVFPRRVNRICELLANSLPQSATVLDVGCGNGQIARQLMAQRSDLRIEGVDVLVRPETFIPVTQFDGEHIPHRDHSFECVMMVDVLHHTDDARILLREAARVARRAVIVKDHYRDSLTAGLRLRLMDYVGNARFGVRLPYKYWSRVQWEDACDQVGLSTASVLEDLRLYPWPADAVFGRGLHFIAVMEHAPRRV